MNKTVTCILIICTLVVFVLIFLCNFKSLTNLDVESAEEESSTANKVSEKNEASKRSTRSKNHNHGKKERITEDDYHDSSYLYSKLTANITKDDVLITGGYKCDNGNMRYSFIQAEEDEYNGEKIVKIKIKNIEISPETANDSNLDYLKTNSNKIFDHFGVLTTEEHRKTSERLNKKGMKVMTMPQLGLKSGAKGILQIGDDNAIKNIDISVKSTILKNGSFDIELEAKQKRN